MTTEQSEECCPSWSRDGRWIYFGSDRSGTLQIWKVPATGGPAVRVTRQGGFEGFESPEGRYFYYPKGRDVPGIWRIAVGGGEETPVLDLYRSSKGSGGTVFAVRGINDLTPRVLAGAGGREPFMSPDGRWLGYLASGELRKISMTGGPPIPIATLGSPLRGVHWGADDRIVFGVVNLSC